LSGTQTERLIEALAARAEPVKRLPHPAWRALIWMTLASASVIAIVLYWGVRSDLAQKLGEPRFVIEVAAALLTSMMAAAAAFCSGCPGRPLWERFAPLPFLVVWLASLGAGCWTFLTSSAATSQAFGIDLTCSQLILVLSLAPAAIMFVMIRRGAPIAPLTTAGLGTLAATALAAVGLRFFHAQDTSLMLLVWQFGTVLVLTAAGALIGQWLQPWQHPRLEGI